MWPKFYKNYPVDSPLIKHLTEPGHGIIGCEMHEINGWGNSCHLSSKQWRALRETNRDSQLGHGDSISSASKL